MSDIYLPKATRAIAEQRRVLAPKTVLAFHACAEAAFVRSAELLALPGEDGAA